MKKLILITLISSFLAMPSVYSSEYVKIQAKADAASFDYSVFLQLEAGDVCEVLFFDATNLTSKYIFCTDLEGGGCTPWSYNSAEVKDLNPVFVGPGNVYVLASDGPSLATAAVRVTRASETGGYLPTNTVVIPTDPSGQVEILMESSTDLVNWTSATPGTYVTSSEKRFFRIRAERAD
jgi:hypothetical protein